MKYRFRLKGTPEDVFDYNFADISQSYKEAKNKNFEDLDHPIVTFQVKKKSQSAAANKKAQKSGNLSLATVKVLKYSRPDHFSFDYKSDTYHKYTEYQLQEYDEKSGYCTYEVYYYDSVTRNGKTTIRTSDSKELKKASFLMQWEYGRALREFVKNRNKTEND